MTIFLIALALVPTAGLIWLLLQKPEYQVQRARELNVPAAQAFAYVRDFNKWPAWNPWLMHEPDARLVFTDATEIGGSYSWDGRHIGAGSMRHAAMQPSSSLSMDLRFLRPFKSQAQVRWKFKELGAQQCQATWSMGARLPLHMRWLRPMLEKAIGMDFELGLAMLAGQLDPKSEHPQIEFVGVCHLEAQQVIARPYSGSFAGMATAAEQCFPELLERAGAKITGPALTIYHKVDLKKQSTECSMAVPVSSAPEAETTLEVAGGKYFKVRLKGSYEFLPNAWYSAMNHLRMRKIKFNKKLPMLEACINSPQEVQSSNELVTELLVPLS